MHAHPLAALAALGLVIVPFPGVAASAPSSKALARRVDAVFAEFTKPGSPGCVLGVIRGGELVYAKGYGLANLEHGIPITRETVFDLGSTSKQFTAASILLLAQEGKLSLDDEVRKYVPEVPDYGTAITIRHLLHHTSGLRDYIDLMVLGGFRIEDWTTREDALAAIARQKALNFKPGDEHNYSNTGYFLLSVIVERVSGKSLPDFVRERIFEPLGMAHSQVLNDHRRVIPRRATAYRPNEGGGFGLDMSNWEQTGDGAVQSTIEDLLKWDRNFYAPKLGGQALLDELQRPGVLNDGTVLTYARGLTVDEYRGLKRVQHGGSWAGYRAQFARFPEERLSVITLCNLASTDPSALAMQVAELYLADRMRPAAAPAADAGAAPAPVVALELAGYAGMFWSEGSAIVRRLLVRDGKLIYHRADDNESELVPLAEGRFLMLGTPTRTEVTVSGGEDGRLRAMEVAPAGGSSTRFVEIEPYTPSTSELEALAGAYASEELDTSAQLIVERGTLVLRLQRGDTFPLNAIARDTFASGDLGALKLLREGGRVTGFAVNVGRARGLTFWRKS